MTIPSKLYFTVHFQYFLCLKADGVAFPRAVFLSLHLDFFACIYLYFENLQVYILISLHVFICNLKICTNLQ